MLFLNFLETPSILSLKTDSIYLLLTLITSPIFQNFIPNSYYYSQ